MAEKIEYLWHSNNDEYAQFWTKGSVQKYFSAPNTGMPPEFINSTADIFAPAPLARDPLPAHGIHAGGYAVHVSGYYHSRRRCNYHVLLFVLSGVFSVSFDGQKRELKRGDALCVPAQCVCGDSVKKGEVSLFWLHLKQSSRLDFGAQPTVFRPEIFESVSAALKIYLDEVYSPRRSISILEKIADIVSELLLREFGVRKDPRQNAAVLRVARLIEKSPAENWDRLAAAKKLKTSPQNADKLFLATLGKTVAKTVLDARMELALKFVKSGERNFATLAKEAGYADVSSLSKAFKRYYGKSLRNFSKEQKAQ